MRRWFQFSLKDMCWATLAVALCTWLGVQIKRNRELERENVRLIIEERNPPFEAKQFLEAHMAIVQQLKDDLRTARARRDALQVELDQQQRQSLQTTVSPAKHADSGNR